MNRKLVAMTLTASLVLAPFAWAGERDQKRRREEPRKHTALGLTVGTIAGILIGGYAAAQMVDEDDSNAGAFIGLWSGFAAAGAIGGYALAGGFSKEADWALAEGREAVHLAEAEAATETPEPIDVELRLSSIAGFEDLAAPAVEAATRIAGR